MRQIQESGEAAQNAIIEVAGSDNLIDRVEQRSNDLGRDGDNAIDVSILGSNNGLSRLSGFAALPNVVDSSIIQEGDTVDSNIYGNKIVLEIIGDDNRYGLRQGGRMNDMGRLLLNGNQNQLGLRQDGTENNIQISSIYGDGNEIGIDQIVTNIADITLIAQSEDNRIYAFQQGTNNLTARIDGNQNIFKSFQDYLSGRGGANLARASMIGDSNFADLQQSGNNLFDLEITGDRNNNGRPFVGVAEIGRLNSGQFVQRGANNDMTFRVSGSYNQFAASQIGAVNIMNVLISGSFNQAAVVQTGNTNVADLIQSGIGDVASIYQ